MCVCVCVCVCVCACMCVRVCARTCIYIPDLEPFNFLELLVLLTDILTSVISARNLNDIKIQTTVEFPKQPIKLASLNNIQAIFAIQY